MAEVNIRHWRSSRRKRTTSHVRTRVKICGITRPQDALAAVAAGADAIGFVLWSRSPRFVEPKKAARISRALPPLVARVGVFVNKTPRTVAHAVRHLGLDAVQLHGDENPADYQACGAAIIKAVSLRSRSDVTKALKYPRGVTLLVDAHDMVKRGGTGQLANWKFARQVARKRPVLLAGGLAAANVGDAIRAVRPWGIDVSSGVETRPGIKSAAKIRALMKRVAAIDREDV